VDAHQALVSIADVPRGKTSLRCPYCQGALTAKKGPITQHHFAHTAATCRPVTHDSDLPILPL
jgi:competence CoiA-like predicted nuclease